MSLPRKSRATATEPGGAHSRQTVLVSRPESPHPRWLVAVLVALALVVASCGGDDRGAGEAADRLQVVVDTDMGFDDVRALMLLLGRPDVEVLAVTVTGTGISRCPAGAHNAAALLSALGHVDIPVGCGRSSPLEGFNTAPTAWRDGADALTGMDLRVGDVEPADAIDVLRDVLQGVDQPVTLLTLGPLTNIAELMDEMSLTESVAQITMMGGAVDVGGNILSFTNFAAEFNIWIDPTAAQRVFGAGVPITLIPLDATNEVPITPAFLDAVTRSTDSAAMIADYNAANPLLGGQFHWDDLAAATLLDPTLASYETITLEVDTEPESDTLGHTRRTSAGAEVNVAVSADREAFEQLFYTELTGAARTTVGAWQPQATIVFDGESCSYEGPDPLVDGLELVTQNTSDVPLLGIVFGTYDPGTTAEDLASFVERIEGGGTPAPPSFFAIEGVAAVPTRTTTAWIVRDLTGQSTAWCALSDDVVEIAGVRLHAEGAG